LTFKERIGNIPKNRIIAALVLILIAVFFLTISISCQAHFKAVEEYPKTDAEITQVFEQIDYNDKNILGGSSFEKRNDQGYLITGYTVHVKYVVDGQTYSRAFDMSSPPGESEAVIYNPQKPREAYLASDPPTSADYYIIAAIFGVIGVVVLFLGDPETKRKNSKG